MATTEQGIDDLLAGLLKSEQGPPAPVAVPRPPQRPKAPPLKRSYTGVLSRRALEPLKQPGLLLLALAFWAISGASTAMQFDDLLAIFGGHPSPLVALGYGIALAFGISTAEVLTSGRRWYILPLAADVGFTVWWLWAPFTQAAARVGAPSWAALVVTAAIGALSAWAPERIVFGERE